MKKFFKLFAVALVAGAMFTACGDDPVTPEGGDTTGGGNTPEPPAVVEGINVTFGEESWTGAADAQLQYVNDPQMGQYAYVFASKVAGGESYPFVNVMGATKVGTAEATYSEEQMSLDNPDVVICEYYEATALTTDQTDRYGDWWAKTASWTVEAFDATALTLTANMEAVMFSAKEAYLDKLGLAGASEKNMTVALGNITLVQ